MPLYWKWPWSMSSAAGCSSETASSQALVEGLQAAWKIAEHAIKAGRRTAARQHSLCALRRLQMLWGVLARCVHEYKQVCGGSSEPLCARYCAPIICAHMQALQHSQRASQAKRTAGIRKSPAISEATTLQRMSSLEDGVSYPCEVWSAIAGGSSCPMTFPYSQLCTRFSYMLMPDAQGSVTGMPADRAHTQNKTDFTPQIRVQYAAAL